ncbi:MAG: hydroxypyruvate isomerase family protein [Paracoccaceae bacterium]|nr:hydroxypyruvate isomerase family protein [Paracoccaceae bacterium]
MLRFAANLSMMFTEYPFLERFDRAAAAGFGAVEFLFPYDFEADEIRAALDRNGLAMALYNTYPGDWERGERGLAALPGRGEEFRDAVKRALDYAAVLKPSRIHIMAGIAGGPEVRRSYIENLAWAAEAGEGQTLCIEPINSRDMPGYHLATSADAIGVLDAVGAGNLGLQFDLYHAQIMEGDLTRRMERLMPRIVHMQIAGVPDRHEPDTGEVNFVPLFAAMDQLGYDGFVGCEYRPKGRTEDGLGWMRTLLGDAG